MSANNQLVVCKIKGKYCVFENGCVDNEFETPKTDKYADYKANTLEEVIKWANEYCEDNMVEYGVDVRI